MIKSYMLTLCAIVCMAFGLSAQVVTTEPSILQIDSQDVVVYFHADKGNKGLMGLAPGVDVYAHTGVITSQSKDDTD